MYVKTISEWNNITEMKKTVTAKTLLDKISKIKSVHTPCCKHTLNWAFITINPDPKNQPSQIKIMD